MAFCEQCGTEMSDSANFCPSCGKARGAPSGQPGTSQTQYQDPESRDIEDNKVMAIFSYILFFIPLLTGDYKTSPFVKYHANQGIILFIASAIWGVIQGILSMFIWFLRITLHYRVFPTAVMFVFGSLVWMAFAGLVIYGIVNAVQGKCKPLPLIGRFTIIK